MAQNGTKLVKERRIAAVPVSAERLAEYIKGRPYGHTVSGLPDDAQVYQVFWDPQRASFIFHFVSKHFEQVPEGAVPGTLLISINDTKPKDTLWHEVKEKCASILAAIQKKVASLKLYLKTKMNLS